MDDGRWKMEGEQSNRYGTWSEEHGRNMEGTWSQEQGTRNKEQGTRTWNMRPRGVLGGPFRSCTSFAQDTSARVG